MGDGDRWTDWAPQRKARRQGSNQMPSARPLPAHGIWCQVFEEAIKCIFCSQVTTAESPDLTDRIEQFLFIFYEAGNSGWVAKCHVLMPLAFWNQD